MSGGLQWWCSATGLAWTWTWRAYPGVWLIVLAIALVYWRLTRVSRRARQHQGTLGGSGASDPLIASDARPHRVGIAVGWAGALLVWIALDWPVGPLAAGYLASVHAVQFLLTAMIAPPLLLYGLRSSRRPATGDRSSTKSVGSRIWRRLTHPLVAAALFNLVAFTTHAPRVVDTLMVSQLGAFAVDTAWLVSGLIFWWPVVMPLPDLPGFQAPLKMLYVFLGTMFHQGIASWMLFTTYPLYGVYELAPPMSGLSAIDDLRLAGGIMSTGGTLFILGVLSVLFFSWVHAQEDESRGDPTPQVRIEPASHHR